MPGATVTVKNIGTNLTRDTVTGRRRHVRISRPAGRHLRHQGQPSRVQDLRAAAALKLGATERVALRAIALRGRTAQRTGHRAGGGALVQTRARPDRAWSPRSRSRTSPSRAATSPALKLLPGVVDTSNREAPGWGSMGGLSINGGRNGGFNFSYDGVTNKDTGSNSGNYSAPGARLDRGSPRPDLELPGRVRPQLRRDDQRRHPQRHPGLARQPAYYKREDASERQRCQRRSSADRNTAQCEPPRTSSTTPATTRAAPCWFPAPTSTRAATSCSSSGPGLPAADRPGNLNQRNVPTELERRGDFSQTFDNNGNSDRHPQSAAHGVCLLPGNMIPSSRIDPNGQALLEPVPAAERQRPERASTTTRSRPCRTAPATTRCCASTGTSRPTPRSTRA